MGKMLRWTLRKAKTDSVEFRREQDRPAVGQKKPGVEFCESLRPPLCK